MDTPLFFLALGLSLLTSCAVMDTSIPLADGRIAHVRQITVLRAARVQLVEEPTSHSLMMEIDPPPLGFLGMLETAIPAALTFIVSLL